MDQVLPSSQVGVKINEWYKMIRQFSVPDAEILKAEVEQEIEEMEEDQDLLVFYSLMCFRHQLMLDSLEPEDRYRDRPTVDELLEKIEKPQKRLTGLLKYYSLFFRGMYEFDHKEYVEAISYYRKAERELNAVSDEMEQAEFHYKIADAYYQIDQHFVSLNHLKKAKQLFEKSQLYKVKVIGCNMMVGANMYDMYRLTEAESYYREALSIARGLDEEKVKRIIGVIFHNLGLVYLRGKNLIAAEENFKKAIDVKEHIDTVYGVRSLYMMANVLYQCDKAKEARFFYETALNRARTSNEEEYLAKLKIINSLYEEYNETEVKQSLGYLEKKRLWSDFAELTEKLGDFHFEKRNYVEGRNFLKKTIHAQTQILKVTEAI
ncbi:MULTISPECIES: Rap family tetratricopeptide repeat protein [Bacillus]|uniref:Rap family tetratricopeptide repeat protein n=1 Tax=Bacillus TaxID=1386 RepID=UPI00057BD82B|nr:MULTISPECIES: Rap family tetratricopeptide repeat protein [Bacillus]MBE7958593.1 tetratricopeptide repeat protein [Bacillus amyloliquefaciens]MBG9462547.1 aspartate phosphatase [Bacillus amyloliquefaciens]MBW8585426.1 tetratricopeptide repeat protein [Bacillus amyloliquefaciens]MBY0195060.1 tetratricopeptide repeat protein [Bacillus velezensis]MCG0044483.1 tetratricopeptide repeat protein [Bacillus velezensis]